MKKIISLSAIFLGVMIAFSSCSKYEDGPAISLKSKAARVAGTYTVDEVYKNGALQEQSDDDGSFEYTLEKDGTGTMDVTIDWFGTTTTFTYDLEWMFNDDETDLMMRSKDQDEENWSDWDSATILRLTDDEIWTQEYDDYDDLWEYHYAEK